MGMIRGFGRAKMPTSRLVGLHELRRLGIEPRTLNQIVDDGENLFAVAVMTMTVGVLAGPFVMERFPQYDYLVAGVTLAALVAWAVDANALQGSLSALAADSFARLSPAYRRRVARHEAGHFTLAYLLGRPVLRYTTSVQEAMRAAVPGAARGVEIEPPAGFTLAPPLTPPTEIGRELGFAHSGPAGRGSARGPKLSQDLVDRYSIIWLAGVVSESLAFKNANGGRDDFASLNRFLRAARPGIVKQDVIWQVRWAAWAAATLLKAQERAVEAVATAMEDGAPVSECIAALEGALEAEALAGVEEPAPEDTLLEANPDPVFDPFE
eukprot:tig00000525_g1956.t1